MSKLELINNIRWWDNLLESLDYDVSWFNQDESKNHDYKNVKTIESIKIPKNRLKILRKNNLKTCFEDKDTKIYEPCQICVKKSHIRYCHKFHVISKLSRHLVSYIHKSSSSENEIINALKELEKRSIKNQLINRGFNFE